MLVGDNPMSRFKLFLIISVAVLISPTSQASAKRVIPDDNLGYPVSISLSDGTKGTGFYLNTESFIYLVTAKHVLFKKPSFTLKAPVATLLSYGRDPSDSSQNIILLNVQEMFETQNLRFHDIHDVAVGRIGKAVKKDNPKILQLYSWAIEKSQSKTGIVGVSIKNTKKLSEVLISNDVFVFGYPSSIGIKQIPQIDYNRPLLRKGIVAGISPTDRSIIIDAAIYGGNSGGPVIQVEPSGFEIKLFLIGLVSQFVPYAEEWLNRQYGYSNIGISNSGYAVVVPVDSILEVVWE
jgi:hypothetical protein